MWDTSRFSLNHSNRPRAGKKLESKPLAASQVQDDENLLASFCPDTPFLRTTIQRIEKDAPMSGYYAFLIG